MGTIGRLKDEFQAILMVRKKVIKLGGGMRRGIVQDDYPQGLRVTVKQAVKVSLDFLMPFPLMDGIQPFPCRIFSTPKQCIPGVLLPRGFHTALCALRLITVADIWTPMQIRGIKEHQSGGSGRLCEIGLRHIMAG